ncbi:MAG: thioredoxin family protein [Nitrospirae bacterium]|nr:thioredoxin family protein [Nitrospirota bacterium]
MKRRGIIVLFVVFCLTVFLVQISAAANAAPKSTPELKQLLGTGKKTVVFFQNPNGGPCKAQTDILQKLLKDRKGNFTIAYVNSMKPEDQKAFYDYGVRNLPSLVLVDGSGNISRVFPPGIQSYETLSQSLDSIK